MAKDFANRAKPTRASTRGGGSAARKKPAARKSTRKSARRPARKPARRPASRHRLVHGPSFSAGIVLGAAVVLLAAYAPELLQETVDRTLAKQSSDPKPAVEFEFQDRLPTEEIRANSSAYGNGQQGLPDAQMEYLLQAASFPQRADADTLRAQLLLSGLPAATNAVRVGDKPWFRVTVGPFPNQVESGRAMTTLRELNLDAFLIKREIVD